MENNLFLDTVIKYDTDKAFYSSGYNDTFFNVREDIKLLFEIGVKRFLLNMVNLISLLMTVLI